MALVCLVDRIPADRHSLAPFLHGWVSQLVMAVPVVRPAWVQGYIRSGVGQLWVTDNEWGPQ